MIEIKYLLIAISDTDTNGQYASGPSMYNMTLGFETRDEAEEELEERKSFYTESSKRDRREAVIIELKEPLTNYDVLYNGWIYKNKIKNL